MTDKTEQQIVAWLRMQRWNNAKPKQRIWLAWQIIRHGFLIFQASATATADAIESGAYKKDDER